MGLELSLICFVSTADRVNNQQGVQAQVPANLLFYCWPDAVDLTALDAGMWFLPAA
jgi:hypothetical protein